MNGGRGSRSAGYTIIETLIFLAVSGGMFLSAMLLIGGRQAKAEFNTSVRNFDSQLQDVANDVSDGYYNSVTNTGKQLDCNVNPVGKIIITENMSAADTQGTNKDCIFIGKALQFEPQNGSGSFNTITLVGKRLSGNADVTSLDQATVQAIAPGTSGGAVPDATVNSKIGGGTKIACVLYMAATVPIPVNNPCGMAGVKVDTISYITNFKGSSINDGALQIDITTPLASSALGRTAKAAVDDLNNYTSATTKTNPASGVIICLESGGTSQHAVIKIGGQGGTYSTITKIYSGSCG